jgi:hypothetical protein
MMRFPSAATDGDNDFNAVTGFDNDGGMLTPGYDFAVPFHRHALAGQAFGGQQLRHRKGRVKLEQRAVEGDLDHGRFYHGGLADPDERYNADLRGRRITALPQLPKLMTRVRLPSPAPASAARPPAHRDRVR